MRPEYFIRLADQLSNSLQNANKEAKLRTAIGRYYYGSFLLCREVFFNAVSPYKERAFRTGKIHSIIKKVFLNIDQYSFIGDFLDELREYRNMCDYNLLKVPKEDLVEICKEYAYEIERTINDFSHADHKKIKYSFFELKNRKEI